MDWIALGFYACICGALSVLAPQLRTIYVRLIVGAIVGIVAAFILPILKALIAV